MRKIEQILKIKIIIYELKRNVLYQQEGEPETIIFLMLDGSHYNYITRLTQAFKTVNNIKCNLCGMKGIIHNKNHVICNDCHLTYKGIECYNQHKIEKCNKFWKCTQCKKTITERKN